MKTFQDYYLKKDYSNALIGLRESKKNLDPGLWHYNMGTVLAKTNDWPMARYHLLLAREAGFNSEELYQNQKFVEDKLEINRLEKPLGPSDYFIKGSLIATEGIFLTFALIAMVVGGWMIRRKGSTKSVAFLVFGTLLPLGLNAWVKSWPRQIVLKPIQIYEGPSALFGQRGELPPGIMIITNEKEDWEEIVYPSRFSGWVKPNGLKKLELE